MINYKNLSLNFKYRIGWFWAVIFQIFYAIEKMLFSELTPAIFINLAVFILFYYITFIVDILIEIRDNYE